MLAAAARANDAPLMNRHLLVRSGGILAVFLGSVAIGIGLVHIAVGAFGDSAPTVDQIELTPAPATTTTIAVPTTISGHVVAGTATRFAATSDDTSTPTGPRTRTRTTAASTCTRT